MGLEPRPSREIERESREREKESASPLGHRGCSFFFFSFFFQLERPREFPFRSRCSSLPGRRSERERACFGIEGGRRDRESRERGGKKKRESSSRESERDEVVEVEVEVEFFFSLFAPFSSAHNEKKKQLSSSPRKSSFRSRSSLPSLLLPPLFSAPPASPDMDPDKVGTSMNGDEGDTKESKSKESISMQKAPKLQGASRRRRKTRLPLSLLDTSLSRNERGSHVDAADSSTPSSLAVD